MASEMFFSLISEAYNEYAKNNANNKTETKDTLNFINILKFNGIGSKENNHAMQELQEAQTESSINNLQLATENQESIINALYQYCIAGGGPLYELIFKKLKNSTAKYEKELPNEIKDTIKDNLLNKSVISLLGFFSTFDIKTFLNDKEQLKKDFINYFPTLYKDPIYISSTIVITTLKEKGVGVEFMQKILQELSRHKDDVICKIIWIFLLQKKILTPEEICNNHTLMTFVYEQLQYFSVHVNDAAINMFDTVIEQLIDNLPHDILSKVLSLPYVPISNETRLQYDAKVYSSRMLSEYGPPALQRIFDMLVHAPELSIKNEAGKLWIETLLTRIDTESLEKILSAIQPHMLEEFYQRKLHHNLFNQLGDPWTLTKSDREKSKHKCLVILKIIEKKDNNALKGKINTFLAQIENIKKTNESPFNYKDRIIAKEILILKTDDDYNESNPNRYYSQNLEIVGTYADTDTDKSTHQLTQLTNIIASTVFYLMQLTIHTRYTDLISSVIIDHCQKQAKSIKLPQQALESALCPLYESIKKTLHVLNTNIKLSMSGQYQRVNNFIFFIDQLITISKISFSADNDIVTSLLDLDTLIQDKTIKSLFHQVMIHMLLFANKNQATIIKNSKLYNMIIVEDISNTIDTAKNHMQTFESYISNTFKQDDAPKLEIDCIEFLEKNPSFKALYIEKIISSLNEQCNVDYYHNSTSVKKLARCFGKIFPAIQPAITIKDFGAYTQLVVSKVNFFNNADNSADTAEKQTFMSTVITGAKSYTGSVYNKFKSGNEEILHFANMIGELPNSSFLKATIYIVYFRVISYKDDIFVKALYRDCFEPALKNLPKITLTEAQQIIMLSEIERALIKAKNANPNIINNRDIYTNLAQDLSLFVEKFSLDLVKLRDILSAAEFYGLSGSATMSNFQLCYFGRQMQSQGNVVKIQNDNNNNNNPINMSQQI